MSSGEREDWYTFRCRMPAEVYHRLEDALDRVKTLAEISEELPDEVQDGLALELIVADFRNTPDESVV